MNHNLSRPAGLSPYINTSSGDLLYVNLSNDVTFLMGSSISIIRGYSTDACNLDAFVNQQTSPRPAIASGVWTIGAKSICNQPVAVHAGMWRTKGKRRKQGTGTRSIAIRENSDVFGRESRQLNINNATSSREKKERRKEGERERRRCRFLDLDA